MEMQINRLSSILILIIVVACAGPLQAGEQKKVLTMDDYGLWRTVTSVQLSSDGEWMTYDYSKPGAKDDFIPQTVPFSATPESNLPHENELIRLEKEDDDVIRVDDKES